MFQICVSISARSKHVAKNSVHDYCEQAAEAALQDIAATPQVNDIGPTLLMRWDRCIRMSTQPHHGTWRNTARKPSGCRCSSKACRSSSPARAALLASLALTLAMFLVMLRSALSASCSLC